MTKTEKDDWVFNYWQDGGICDTCKFIYHLKPGMDGSTLDGCKVVTREEAVDNCPALVGFNSLHNDIFGDEVNGPQDNQ